LFARLAFSTPENPIACNLFFAGFDDLRFFESYIRIDFLRDDIPDFGLEFTHNRDRR
jgi:hypothetical protein